MQMQLHGSFKECNAAVAVSLPACADNGAAAQYQYAGRRDTSWPCCSAE